MIHFCIRDDTLCGADYIEPSKKVAKDGRLCDDCIQVMWKEQYRRNVLSKFKKVKKVKESKLKKMIMKETLPPHRGIKNRGLFLKNWSGY